MEVKSMVSSNKMFKIVIKSDGIKVKFERAQSGIGMLKAYNGVFFVT